MILGLFAMSAVYAESTTETLHVTDKKIISDGYEKSYLYIVHTQET